LILEGERVAACDVVIGASYTTVKIRREHGQNLIHGVNRGGLCFRPVENEWIAP
jgi:hypothetical protein